VNAPAEVSHSKDHNNHSPFRRIVLALHAPISALIFDSATCISVADDITQVAVVSVVSSTMLLLWSDSTGRVPTRTLLVVIIMTPGSILLVTDWIHYYCHVQHHLEALYVHVDFFIIFREMGGG
jgi:hypothetical protein